MEDKIEDWSLTQPHRIREGTTGGPTLMDFRSTLGWILLLTLLLACPTAPESKQDKRSSNKAKCPAGMVDIPTATYRRGSATGRLDEQPVRSITVTRFCLDRKEVTIRAYRRCVAAGVCKFPRNVPRNYPYSWPMVGVRWTDAKRYCRWAKKRLPSEAEWERAARGKQAKKTYPIAGKLTCRKANYGALPTYPCQKGHTQAPRTVGSYPPGPFGLLDLAGNAHEWVEDCYSPQFYAKSKDKNPVNQDCNAEQSRVLRGGSLASPPKDLRVTARKSAWPSGSFLDVGFRCAKTP